MSSFQKFVRNVKFSKICQKCHIFKNLSKVSNFQKCVNYSAVGIVVASVVSTVAGIVVAVGS
jgi:hypothetical protein